VPVITLAVVVFGCMLVEARRAAANERAQRARGGVEASGDVYVIMRLAYPAVFAAMMFEGIARGASVADRAFVAGLMLFAIAKALKWWAISSLGRYWTFRVIVVPGTIPVSAGPYRVLNHPNYVAVIGELVGVALMTSAWLTGPLVVLLFGALIARRVAVENRALDAILRRS
jgi:methyltransferase